MKMIRQLLVICLLALTSPAHAAITPNELRDLAYAGDVHGAEAAMAQAHAESVAGAITYDDLRDIVSVLLTTHPDVNDFTKVWLEEIPESPYALTIRSMQQSNVAWDVRGERMARDTHWEAMQTFVNMQKSSFLMAYKAYQIAPDFVLASDAIFEMHFTRKILFEFQYNSLVVQVMATTPNYGSLDRAMNVHHRNWRGRGVPGVRKYCEKYAPLIPDFDEYPVDVCVVDFAEQTRDLDRILPLADDLLARSDHPTLEHVRRKRAFERKNDQDRRMILDYLSDPEVTDYATASRFLFSFYQDAESGAVLAALESRLQRRAFEDLPHDPFSPRLIKILTSDYNFVSGLGKPLAVHDMNDVLKRRLVVARPFDSNVWHRAARSFDASTQKGQRALIAPYYANAIHYSDHSPYQLSQYSAHLHRIHYIYKSFAVGRNLVDYEVMDNAEFREQVECPMVRLYRLTEARCASITDEVNCKHFNNDLNGSTTKLAQMDEARICPAISDAPIEDLLFTPTAIDISTLTDGIANR